MNYKMRDNTRTAIENLIFINPTNAYMRKLSFTIDEYIRLFIINNTINIHRVKTRFQISN